MLKKLITISITAIASLQAATTYDKSLSNGNDDLNYWSDTTSSNLTNHTLVGATEVFTIGSRKNIPNVPTTSIKVSTNKLCSDDRKGLVSCSKSDSLEPRYTDDGLATSGESNLRTWYKATTPKSVNGVVDDPCVTLLNTGSVVNWWSDFGNLRCERTITTYTPKVNSTIYTNKVSSIIYANKISGSSSYVASSQNGLICNYTVNKARGSVHNYSCDGQTITLTSLASLQLNSSTSGFSRTSNYNSYINRNPYSINAYSYGQYSGSSENRGVILWYVNVYKTQMTCPSGGTLSGSTCITTTSTCPSGYSDNGANCKQTIQICPDASWSSATATTCSKVIQVCPDASWTDNGANCRKNVPEYKLFSTF